MSITDDLTNEVAEIFRETWSARDGLVIPDPDAPNLALGNDGINLDATMLYADMAESTDLVTNYPAKFAAEVIKAYLHCACKLIRAQGGQIVSFDGDRVMAVFIGNLGNTSAVRAALAINHAVVKVIRPRAKLKQSNYSLAHGIGIDSGKVLVARTGIRKYNDLVWVGSAANVAAKLSAMRVGGPTFITGAVHAALDKSVRISVDGQNMWSYVPNTNKAIISSSWMWSL